MKIKRIIAAALSAILITGTATMQAGAIITPRVSIAPRVTITPRVTPRVAVPKSTPKAAPKVMPKTTTPKATSDYRISLNPFSRYFFLWLWFFGNNDDEKEKTE